jgi:hypothetical protein
LFWKEVIFTACIILFTGCAGSRKIDTAPDGYTGRQASAVLVNTSERNISNSGFFIHKGRIQTSGESGRISLFFSMKFNPPYSYLISLRSKSGMEAFRIYLNSDTVLINDRLNKSVLYGNINDFERITGLPAALLRVSYGDIFLIDPKLQPGEVCIDNEVKLNEYFLGLMVKTTIDCLKEKVKSVMLTTGVPDEFITIEYKKHREDHNRLPKKVEINDFRRKIKITLSLDKYTTPWVGDIEFIPGTGYSVKPLL